MGVDCKIALPPNVEIDTVARIIGISAGLPCEKQSLGLGIFNNAWSAEVKGIDITSVCPQMAQIKLIGFADKPLVDGENEHFVFYHFEGSEVKGGNRLLMPRSTGFWLAIGVKLVQFFGGAIMPQDCNGKWTYKVPAKPNHLNCPQDGEPWQNLQERILAVKPITEQIITHYE